MKRIQRKRTYGWRMPENAIYCGRPSMWSNPFRMMGDIVYFNAGYRRMCLGKWVPLDLPDGVDTDILSLFKKMLYDVNSLPVETEVKEHFMRIRANIMKLKDHDLLCWCTPDKPCHVDVLIEFYNEFQDRRNGLIETGRLIKK